MKTALKTLERALRCLALLACCLLGADSQSYMNETGAEVAEAVAASVTEAPGPHAAGSAGPHAVELVAYAPAPGRVVFSGTVVNRKVLVIAHPDGRRSTFEPMDEALPVGTEVTAGDAVGTVAAPESAGENGERPYRRCSAPCLYWGVRQGGARGDGSGREAEYVNPMSLLGSQDPSILLPVPGGY